jgi:hypothetical protein
MRTGKARKDDGEVGASLGIVASSGASWLPMTGPVDRQLPLAVGAPRRTMGELVWIVLS